MMFCLFSDCEPSGSTWRYVVQSRRTFTTSHTGLPHATTREHMPTTVSFIGPLFKRNLDLGTLNVTYHDQDLVCENLHSVSCHKCRLWRCVKSSMPLARMVLDNSCEREVLCTSSGACQCSKFCSFRLSSVRLTCSSVTTQRACPTGSYGMRSCIHHNKGLTMPPRRDVGVVGVRTESSARCGKWDESL
jgi:hypothetical protein